MPIIDKLLIDVKEAMEADDKATMSIEATAKLLGIDDQCLRISIANGSCPFGIGGEHRTSGKKFGRVSKLALWAFLTKGVR